MTSEPTHGPSCCERSDATVFVYNSMVCEIESISEEIDSLLDRIIEQKKAAPAGVLRCSPVNGTSASLGQLTSCRLVAVRGHSRHVGLLAAATPPLCEQVFTLNADLPRARQSLRWSVGLHGTNMGIAQSFLKP